jgi:hypothetical protein
LKALLEPILEAVDADVLVTGDAEDFKKVSAETGRFHQVCKSHVGRDTDALADEFSAIISSSRNILKKPDFGVRGGRTPAPHTKIGNSPNSREVLTIATNQDHSLETVGSPARGRA